MTVLDPVKPGPRPAPAPDVITIYRTTVQDETPRADDTPRYRWIRRTGAGTTKARSHGNFRHKAQAWRDVRRTQLDWEQCRIVDETGTWDDPQGGTNLNREPTPPTPPRRAPISPQQARGRL